MKKIINNIGLSLIYLLLTVNYVHAQQNDKTRKISLTEYAKNNFEMVVLASNYQGSEILNVNDINHDGYLDIVQTSWDRNEVVMYLNNKKGNFIPELVGVGCEQARNVIAAQVYDSPYKEILVCAFKSQEFVLYSNKNNLWEKEVLAKRPWPAGVDAGDINQDGSLDIVLVSHGETNKKGMVEWFENKKPDSSTQTSSFKDSFAKLFAKIIRKSNWESHPIDFIKELHAVKLYDYDNDNDLDVFASADKGMILAYWENDGKGIFDKRKIIDEGKEFGFMTVVDIDQDGNPDILTTCHPDKNQKGWLIWYENENGQWTKKIIDEEYPWCYWIDVVDLNNDGNLDIVAVSDPKKGGDLTYWENRNGVFFKLPLVVELTTPRSVDHGDFNNDNKMDLAVTSYNDDLTFLLLSK